MPRDKNRIAMHARRRRILHDGSGQSATRIKVVFVVHEKGSVGKSTPSRDLIMRQDCFDSVLWVRLRLLKNGMHSCDQRGIIGCCRTMAFEPPAAQASASQLTTEGSRLPDAGGPSVIKPARARRMFRLTR